MSIKLCASSHCPAAVVAEIKPVKVILSGAIPSFFISSKSSTAMSPAAHWKTQMLSYEW